MAVYKIDAKKVQGQEGLIYLYLYKLETGQKQPILNSLKIKIPLKYWIADKQRVSKELPNKYLKQEFETVDKLNKWLSERLEEFIKINGDLSFIPTDEKTINSWIETIIKRTVNIGTRTRYENIKFLVEKFQLFHSKETLKKASTKIVYFRNLDVNWIEAFKLWLITINNNEKNSSNFKVKALAGMIRKAHIERWYRFTFFPFDGVKHQFEDTDVEILNLDELKRFISTPLIEVSRRRGTTISKELLWKTPTKENILLRNKNYKKRAEGYHTLNDIRNYWLFQLFTQGIRVSDLITLRWNDFKLIDNELRIKKKMFKTKKYVDILVSDKQTEIIEKYIVRYDILKQYSEKINALNKFINDAINESYFLNQLDCDDKLYTIATNWIDEHTDANGTGFYINKELLVEIENRNGFGFNEEELEFQNLTIIENWLNEQIKLSQTNFKHQKFNVVCDMIIKLSKHKEYKTDFVFNLMRNQYFSNIGESNDFGYIDEDQYRKFQSARTLYNNLLKIVAFQCGIEKNLTSHIARHSYTSLMIDLGVDVNLFDVMTSLGHKHITTTQNYIQRFSNKKVDKLNLIIANELDK
jgi:integrase